MTSEESSLPETLILNTSGKGARIFRFKMTDLALLGTTTCHNCFSSSDFSWEKKNK
jgi:hypothetical protein